MLTIGVDEVGRGALAGPAVVCVFCFLENGRVFSDGDIVDSKKMSDKLRRKYAQDIELLKKCGGCDFELAEVSVEDIAEYNVSGAISRGAERVIKKLLARVASGNGGAEIICDYGIRPKSYVFKDLARADEHFEEVACASILAKVYRDDLMRKLAERFVGYGWERNVGYGTREHLLAIRELGVVGGVHRESFNLGIGE